MTRARLVNEKGAPFLADVPAPLLHVVDEKAAGTDGGTFTSGAWRTRTLNTNRTQEGTFSSVASNQITLVEGTYRVRAHAPAHMVDNHKIRLQNITAGTTLFVGSAMYAAAAAAVDNHSHLAGQFTLTAISALELQHQCSTTRATDGFGVSPDFGATEVFAEVWIEKVG